MATPGILRAPHNRFLFRMLATFEETSPTKLSSMLADPEVAVQHRFKPIVVSPQAIAWRIGRVDVERLKEARKQFLEAVEDEPLAHKRHRVAYLQRLIVRTRNSQTLSDLEKITLEARLLRQVQDEIGENVDKMAKAVRDGGTTVNLLFPSVKDMDNGQRQHIRRNLHVVYGGSNGDRFSDN